MPRLEMLTCQVDIQVAVLRSDVSVPLRAVRRSSSLRPPEIHDVDLVSQHFRGDAGLLTRGLLRRN